MGWNLNKKGFTLIETALGTLIVTVISVSSIGIYSSYTGNLDEAVTGVASKIEYTQQHAKNRNASLVAEVPRIELNNNSVKSILDFDGKNYKYKESPYINNLTNNIKVISNIPNNKLYFSTQGYPIDEKGKLLEDVRIYVIKTVLGVESIAKTIKIDCSGNITVSEGKDNSSKQTCVLSNKNEVLEKVLVCASGQEIYNGVCVTACKYDQKRTNGVCKDICPTGQVYSSDDTCKTLCNSSFILNPTTNRCECASGYEVFNNVCVAECPADKVRNYTTGACVDAEGLFPIGQEKVVEVPRDAKYMTFKIWGGGGGGGGSDHGDGGNGGGGGFVSGKIAIKSSDNLIVLVGSNGGNGTESADNTRAYGASSSEFGGGGAGGSTGTAGTSGSGGAGGGASYIKINNEIIALAGGGGGGGGGSGGGSPVYGLDANACSTQASSSSGMTGGTCPSDGGGGGGGGGSLPNGGAGGRNGVDANRGNVHAGGGCYGRSFLSSKVFNQKIENPSGALPGGRTESIWKQAGMPALGRSRGGKANPYNLPDIAKHGKIAIKFYSK